MTFVHDGPDGILGEEAAIFFFGFLTGQFELEQTTLFSDSSITKAVPLQELKKELFRPMDQDKTDLTSHLVEYAKVVAEALVAELINHSKGAWKLLPESEDKLLWDHSTSE
jgi:hypothetical protein